MEVKRQSEVGHVFLLDNSFWGMSANEHKDIFNCIIEESKINGEVPPFLEFKIGDREYTYYTGKKMMNMKLEKDIANKRYIQISIGEDNQEAKMNVIANFKYNIEKKYEPATSSKRDLNKENKPMYKIVNISELSREARIRRAKENPNISYTKGVSIITKNGVVSSTSLDKLSIEAFDKLENIDGKLVDEESTDIKRVYKKAYLTDAQMAPIADIDVLLAALLVFPGASIEKQNDANEITNIKDKLTIFFFLKKIEYNKNRKRKTVLTSAVV